MGTVNLLTLAPWALLIEIYVVSRKEPGQVQLITVTTM
jgi:hypothetical protein